eukprot:6264284-Amphidinium_carterae.8
MPRGHDFYWCCPRKDCAGWERVRKGDAGSAKPRDGSFVQGMAKIKLLSVTFFLAVATLLMQV